MRLIPPLPVSQDAAALRGLQPRLAREQPPETDRASRRIQVNERGSSNGNGSMRIVLDPAQDARGRHRRRSYLLAPRGSEVVVGTDATEIGPECVQQIVVLALERDQLEQQFVSHGG